MADVSKKTTTALERLDKVEANISGLHQGVIKVLSSVQETVNGIDERHRLLYDIVECLVATLEEASSGTKTKVEDKIKELGRIRVADAYAQQQANVARLLERGDLEKADTVEEATIICGQEYGSDGAPIPPGTIAPLTSFVAEVKDLLLGKGPGALVDVPGDRKFEVLEIYRPGTPKTTSTETTVN
jgi:hypothetical protein